MSSIVEVGDEELAEEEMPGRVLLFVGIGMGLVPVLARPALSTLGRASGFAPEAFAVLGGVLLFPF